MKIYRVNDKNILAASLKDAMHKYKRIKTNDVDWDFMNKIRNYPVSKVIIALKNIGRYSRFGENFTWADLAGKLNYSEKDKLLKELLKIKDSIQDDITYDTRLKGAGSEVRNLCIKNNWYTEGDNTNYAKLLKGCDNGWTIAEIAKDIAEHSRGVWTTDVARELRRLVEYKPHLAMKDSIHDDEVENSIKDGDYSYEVIKEQIDNPNFATKRLLQKAYNGLTRGEITRQQYEELKKILEKRKSNYDSSYTKVYDEDIDELSTEEQQAIDDYRKAIQGTSNPKLLALYAHILKEEVEHLEELQGAKEGKFVEDANDYISATIYPPYADAAARNAGYSSFKAMSNKYRVNVSSTGNGYILKGRKDDVLDFLEKYFDEEYYTIY